MNDTHGSAARHRLLLAATACVALGTAILLRSGTAINTRLFMNEGFAHVDSVQLERTLAIIAIACVPALFIPRVRAIAAAAVFVLAALLGWASADQGGYPYSAWALPAHAMRIGAPLALLLALYASTTQVPARGTTASWLMRHLVALAAATVFLVHGIEALGAHPWFVDLTIASVRRVLDARWSQSVVERLLLVVGLLDITAAVAVLTVRSRIAIYWMGCWGIFTAVLRVVAYGTGALGETIVRFPHGLLPLVLLPTFAHRLQQGVPLHRHEMTEGARDHADVP